MFSRQHCANFFPNPRVWILGCAFLAACSGPEPTATEEHSDAARHVPAEVLAHVRPQEIYRAAWHGFRFSAQTRLRGVPGEETVESRAILESDGEGNYHLLRIPFLPEAAVEIFHVDQKYYLRTGASTNFLPVDRQAEFERWVVKSIHEVFSLFETAGFGTTAGDPTSCEKKPNGSLCWEPASGLPVRGTIRSTADGGLTLETGFLLSPPGPEPLRILAP